MVARVAGKLRFVPFSTRTRSATLPAPTTDATMLEAAALQVLELFEALAHSYRLQLQEVKPEGLIALQSAIKQLNSLTRSLTGEIGELPRI